VLIAQQPEGKYFSGKYTVWITLESYRAFTVFR
jgi:hypothetical protein